jgi:tRNA (adenine22-N1)-methyltransferase
VHIRLSQRLQQLADAVPRGSRFVDVGTDHAHIPIYLLQTKRVTSAIAADIVSGPLQSAKQNIDAYHLQDFIEVRQSDGLSAIAVGEVDTVLIAGMGGQVQQEILEARPDVVSQLKRLILQPMNAGHRVRKYLDKLAYPITEEKCMEEDGRLYEIIIAEVGACSPIKADLYAAYREDEARLHFAYEFGPLMLESPNPLVKQRVEQAVIDAERILSLLTHTDRPDVMQRQAALLAERDVALSHLKAWQERTGTA